MSNGFFSFKNKMYLQKIGLAMDDLVSPVISDILLDDIFTKLNRCFNGDIFSKKFVDDSLLYVRTCKINDILSYINSYHPNIKFTLEIQKDNFLQFLDLTIYNLNDKFITEHYTKETACGRILNYFSYNSHVHKINALNNLINRHLSLSDGIFHKKHIAIIYKIANDNCFPKNLVRKCVYCCVFYIINNKKSRINFQYFYI